MGEQKALYDEEWVKEMMQFKKAELIDLFRGLCLDRDRQVAVREQLVGATTEILRMIEEWFDRINEAMNDGTGREDITRMCGEASARVAQARKSL